MLFWTEIMFSTSDKKDTSALLTLEIMKKVNIFVTNFRKWNPYIIIYIEIFQAFISWNFYDYAYR